MYNYCEKQKLQMRKIILPLSYVWFHLLLGNKPWFTANSQTGKQIRYNQIQKPRLYSTKRLNVGPLLESFSNSVEIKTGQVDPVSEESPKYIGPAQYKKWEVI